MSAADSFNTDENEALEPNTSPVYVPSEHGSRWVDPRGFKHWRAMRNIRAKLDTAHKALTDCSAQFVMLGDPETADIVQEEMCNRIRELRTFCDKISANLVEQQERKAKEQASAYLHMRTEDT